MDILFEMVVPKNSISRINNLTEFVSLIDIKFQKILDIDSTGGI